MTAKRWIGAVLGVALGSAVASPTVWAQAQDTTETTTPAAEAATVSLDALPRRLQSDTTQVQRIAQRAQSLPPRSGIKDRLEGIEADIARLDRHLPHAQLKQLALPALVSLERQWGFTRDHLDELITSAEAEAEPLARDAETLRNIRKSWSELQAGGLIDRQPLLQARVKSLLSETDSANRTLAVPLDRFLALSQRAATLRNEADLGEATLQRELARRDRGLGSIDSAPLWQSEAWRKERSEPTPEGNIELDFLEAYEAKSHPLRDLVSLATLAGLLATLVLRKRLRKASMEDAGLGSYRGALQRPWSIWALLSLVALAIVQIDGPMLHLQLLLLMALVPAMRLQPPHVRALFGRWFYLGGLLYFIHIVAGFVAGDALVHRLLLAGLALALAGGLAAWWFGRGSATREAKDWRARGLRIGAVVASLLAMLALGANLVGNVTLANVLVTGIIESLYIGLLVFAAVHVIDALWAFLMAQGFEALSTRTRHAGELFVAISRVARAVLVGVWVVATLSAFRILSPVGRWLEQMGALGFSIGDMSISLGGVAIFVASVWVSFWLAGTLQRVLAGDILPAINLPRGVGNSIATLSYYALLLAGLGIALSIAGFEFSQLTLVIGALGVGIGLGLQDVVRNFVSGLILMVERPIQPGDLLELDGGAMGKVREIGMRATRLNTYEGADIVVPNGLLIANRMTNWTLSNERRRVDLSVGVAYGHAPRDVIAVIERTLDAVPGVQSSPAPAVLFEGFGDNALLFVVRAWTRHADDAAVLRSEMGIAIHDALQAAGMAIPFPQRELHVRSWPEPPPRSP